MAHETATQRRKRRTRYKLKKNAPGKLRMSVYRSNMNMAVQIIDDAQGKTLVSATTLEKALRKELKSNGRSMAAAELIGKTIGERAKKAGIADVMFDRGSYRFTGRLKVLADAARAAGLKF
ncbi:MAG: 50S ribosomal protein L18 [Pseudomonadaceae bacterium]|nr:50S ribosomal protein L18 [Pseudomonadaceae bacterium]